MGGEAAGEESVRKGAARLTSSLFRMRVSPKSRYLTGTVQ